MNSFQSKIGWKKMRKREIKINVPFCSVPTRCVTENSIKIVKNSKIKEIRLWFISSQNRSEKDEKYGKKKLSFRFVPTRRVEENSKKN